jgi:hypothetical protein
MTNITIEPGWLHKTEAAALLDVSIRQLENLAALKRIRKNRLPRQPNERSARVLYSVEDIEAIKNGTPNLPEALPEPAQTPGMVLRREMTASIERLSETIREEISTSIEHLGELAERQMLQFAKLGENQVNISAGQLEQFGELMARTVPPAIQKPWLTLAEAAEWSGLPAAWLVAQARAGAAFAVNVGRGSKAHWRFNREMLGKV